MNIYTIKDAKAEFYMSPFYARAHGEAIRTFSNAVNTKHENNQINLSPADYSLFFVGSFDEQTGEIEATPPHHLGNGLDFKAQ